MVRTDIPPSLTLTRENPSPLIHFICFTDPLPSIQIVHWLPNKTDSLCPWSLPRQGKDVLQGCKLGYSNSRHRSVSTKNKRMCWGSRGPLTQPSILMISSWSSSVYRFITTDVAKFCDTLSSLYSNLAKPLLDTVIFNYQLTRSIGWLGTFGLGVNYIVTAKLLRAVTPSFGKLAAIEAKLEASQFGNGIGAMGLFFLLTCALLL